MRILDALLRKLRDACGDFTDIRISARCWMKLSPSRCSLGLMTRSACSTPMAFSTPSSALAAAYSLRSMARSTSVQEDQLHRKRRDGTVDYYHCMLSAIIVAPDQAHCLHLMPEFIENLDGNDKQDCERNAAKRRLRSNKAASIAHLRPIFLGDDLDRRRQQCHRDRRLRQNSLENRKRVLQCIEEPWIQLCP